MFGVSWIDQGRQEHGWFGHGTSAAGSDAGAREAATRVAYGALGVLPAAQRRTYESWPSRGGLDQVAKVLPAWVAGARLSGASFRDALFDSPAVQYLAGHAQEVGRALAAEDDKAAGRSFAAPVTAARPEGMGRAMAAMVSRAGKPGAQAVVQHAARRNAPGEAARPGAPAHARPAAPPRAPAPPVSREEAARALRLRNIAAMATVIWNEARQERDNGMAAVGYTLRNRMERNGETQVERVWDAYNHSTVHPNDAIEAAACARAREIAAQVIDGTIPDQTQGATHYYSPQNMPRENGSVRGRDVAGGLETVPGITDPRGNPVQTYMPGWRADSRFIWIPTPDFPERVFKFYRRDDGAGRVR